MTKPIKASETGLTPHYKVRVALTGSILHLASWTKPTLNFIEYELDTVDADWIDDPAYGDTLGLIHWPSVAAITWRWSA